MTTGARIPTSPEIVLLLASSISVYNIPQTRSVAKIAEKLKSETFKNRTLIGTKKKIITTRHGTKNGYTNILYKAPFIPRVSIF